MKKKFALLAFAALGFAALATTGCKDPVDDTVKVESVTLDADTKTLTVGDSFTLTATVLPSTADNKIISWVSTDTSIATVTDGGVVTAVAKGEATITANSSDGSGKSDSCVVTVTAEGVVTISSLTGQSLTEVNEIKYSEAFDGEGNPVPVAVKIEADKGIASVALSLTTDNAFLNGVLAGMGLTEPFELGSLSAEQIGALTMIGIPSGEDVIGKDEVTLPFSGIVALVCGDNPGIPGGINQFDITIEAEDAEGEGADSQTLKLKFIDDKVYVAIEGDGFDIAETQTVNKSDESPEMKLNISAINGIDQLLVDIDSPALNGLLTIAGLGGEFDLANPDAALTGALAMLGRMGITLPAGDAVKDKTELEFDVTPFIPLLFSMTGDATISFKLTVKDAAENEDVQTLTLDLVDDLKVAITGDGIAAPLEIKASEAGTIPVVVDIEAPQGIENLFVTIESSHPAFVGGLAQMGLGGEFDLANPGDLGAILSSPAVGLPNGADVKGKTELEFNITNFVPMIFGTTAMGGGGDLTADFTLRVVDTKGTEKEATIALVLIDDSAE